MFHSSRHVFNKKEVEKHAAKIGIVAQAVEPVLKELVSDDLVKEGKVGISTYFWAFPGELGTKKKCLLAAEEELVRLVKDKVESLEKTLRDKEEANQSEQSAEDEKERAKLMESIACISAQKTAVDEQLKRLVASSALDMHARKRDIAVLKDAANRWTDNIFQVRRECVDKFGLEARAFDQSFELEGLEYLD